MGQKILFVQRPDIARPRIAVDLGKGRINSLPFSVGILAHDLFDVVERRVDLRPFVEAVDRAFIAVGEKAVGYLKGHKRRNDHQYKAHAR